MANLRSALARGETPADFATKLDRLADTDLASQFIAQNSRLFISLLLASQDGSFRGASLADRARLFRVLAYVRKDDDFIPDYSAGGLEDDRQEVRSAVNELSALLRDFKAWRLRHQVPRLWLIPEAIPARIANAT